MQPARTRFALVCLLGLAACHPSTLGTPPPGPEAVAEAAFAAAATADWNRVVQSMDSQAVTEYRDAMIQASDFVLAAKPRIYAQADSISPETAAFYGRLNAMNAAGGPLLAFMGAKTVDELRPLSPAQFIARFLSGIDSLSALHDRPRATRAYRFEGKPQIRDSVATLKYVLTPGPAGTFHLIRKKGSWRLGGDAMFPLFVMASR